MVPFRMSPQLRAVLTQYHSSHTVGGGKEVSVSGGLKRFPPRVLTCQGDVRIEDHGRNHLRSHGRRPHVVGVVVHRGRRPSLREDLCTWFYAGSPNSTRKQQQRLEKFVQKVLKPTRWGRTNNNESSSPRGTQAGAMSIPAEWFGIADVDGDGKVSGGEAVAFFTRAGLPQASLATLWELADNPPRGFLERKQFDVAMQLITVAQVRTRVCRPVVFSLSRTRKTSFVGDLARSRARRPVGRDPSSAFQTSHLRCRRSDVAHLRRAAGS